MGFWKKLARIAIKSTPVPDVVADAIPKDKKKSASIKNKNHLLYILEEQNRILESVYREIKLLRKSIDRKMK